MSDDQISIFKFAFISSAQTLALAELIAHPGEVVPAEVMAVSIRACAYADRIPEGYSPTQAAMEVVRECLGRYRRDEFVDPAFPQPSWLPGRDDWEPTGEIEECVDGEFGPENPNWRGLPGGKSADLNILAALRDRPAQRYHELAAAVSLSETYVRKTLQSLEREGSVVAAGRPARWSLSKAVTDELQRMPKPKANPPEPAVPFFSSGNSAGRSKTVLAGAVGAPPEEESRSADVKRPPRQLNKQVEDDIVAALRASPAQRCHQLAAALSSSEPRIRKYLHELEIRRVVEQDRGRPVRWSLSVVGGRWPENTGRLTSRSSGYRYDRKKWR